MCLFLIDLSPNYLDSLWATKGLLSQWPTSCLLEDLSSLTSLILNPSTAPTTLTFVMGWYSFTSAQVLPSLSETGLVFHRETLKQKNMHKATNQKTVLLAHTKPLCRVAYLPCLKTTPCRSSFVSQYLNNCSPEQLSIQSSNKLIWFQTTEFLKISSIISVFPFSRPSQSRTVVTDIFETHGHYMCRSDFHYNPCGCKESDTTE